MDHTTEHKQELHKLSSSLNHSSVSRTDPSIAYHSTFRHTDYRTILSSSLKQEHSRLQEQHMQEHKQEHTKVRKQERHMLQQEQHKREHRQVHTLERKREHCKQEHKLVHRMHRKHHHRWYCSNHHWCCSSYHHYRYSNQIGGSRGVRSNCHSMVA